MKNEEIKLKVMENNKLHFDKDDIEQELRAEKAEIADKLYT